MVVKKRLSKKLKKAQKDRNVFDPEQMAGIKI